MNTLLVALALLLAAPPALADPAPTAEVEVDIELLAMDGDGEPLAELHAADLALAENNQARRVVALERAARPRHLVLAVDLASTSPAERLQALPRLRTFLIGRLALGDRVTVLATGGAATGRDEPFDVLCRFVDQGPALEAAFDTLLAYRGVQHDPHGDRDTGRRLAEDYGRLAAAVALLDDDGRPTDLLHLGPALSAGVGQAPGHAGGVVDVIGGEVGQTGTVQYLVTLPREGAPAQRARKAGETLLAAAAAAEVALHAVVPGAVATLADPWLAAETGGRTLPIEQLDAELARLARLWAGAWRLRFAVPAAEGLRPLELRLPAGSRARFARHFLARSPEVALAARARAALNLGAPPPPGWQVALRAGEKRQDSFAATLELTLPQDALPGDSGQLTVAVALAKSDGELIVRRQLLPWQRPPGAAPLRLRLPLHLPASSRELGVAADFGAPGLVPAAWRVVLAQP